MKRIIPEIYVSPCEEALRFYATAFGAEIQNVKKADDNPMFKGHEGKIMHAELHAGESCILYFVDVLEESQPPIRSHLMLELDSEEEINRIYQALLAGGTVGFELQKTFWGALHAVVTDRYGNIWGLNYTLPRA